MIAWGINALNHGSSLAVFKDEKLISNVFDQEDELPTSIITAALHNGAPDRIFWYERPWVKKARQLYAGQYATAMDMLILPRRYLNKIRVRYASVTYTPHHASHAAAGYYTSPFNHCAIVVLDAIGEFECATIWEGKHGEMKKVWSRKYPHSLGLFYSAFTKLIGLEPIKEEYILQKMAEQGDSNRYHNEVKSYVEDTVKLTRNLHKGVLDWPYPINNLQEQCDIAAAVQQVFEDQVSAVMIKVRQLINTDSLVYMGGCAMNSKANENIIKDWNHVWSLPNPGDPSSSIGAVLYHTKQRVWDYNFGVAKHISIKI